MPADTPSKDPDPARKLPQEGSKQTREERLAAQLRANLRRRKQAARQAGSQAEDPMKEED